MIPAYIAEQPVTETARELPADVWDTLELSALVFGGIGANDLTENDGVTPFCVLGHFDWAEPGFLAQQMYAAFSLAVEPEMVSKANNRAVRAINERKGASDIAARVSWPEYTRELQIVRGE